MMASALAPTGAMFTFLALWTGALWGKPTWGTWWVWDARLTSELILLFLYFGFMALKGAIADPQRADRAGAILALVGVVNVPIIYFSVQWWNTLHQGASVSLTRSPSMAASMLAGMLLMALAAWMSMFIYLVMAGWAALGFVLNTRLSGMMASSLAPTGAMFAFLALWTGALWGKPTWGTYWVWDARLTSELVLLFLYLGFIALKGAIPDPVRADRAGAVLALLGAVNVPIIYFSVQWWSTLHQGASVSLTRAPAMAATMLLGMLLMALAAWMYSIAASLARLRAIILEREQDAAWVRLQRSQA